MNQSLPPPPRRSARNHNRISMPSRGKSSLEYQRWEDLFFSEDAKEDVLVVDGIHLQPVFRAPNIYIVENFLSSDEVDQMLDKTHNKKTFETSIVDNTDTMSTESGDDQYRTSTFVSFASGEDPTVRRIEARALKLMGRNVSSDSQSVEPLQLVRYHTGQYFKVHHDMGDYDDVTGTVALPDKSTIAKRRMATIFCYLNDVDLAAGGCTIFPKCCSLKVEPKKGRAVIFCNVTKDGQPDPRTVHEAEELVVTPSKPVKYGLNVWILEA